MTALVPYLVLIGLLVAFDLLAVHHGADSRWETRR
jgi:hypothetical protein